MTPRYIWTRSLQFAGVAVAASVVLFLSAGWRATHLSPLPSTSLSDARSTAPRADFYREGLPSELDRAVDSDPFRPDRSRPQIRYQLPGTAEAVPKEAVAVEQPIVLLGTMVIGGEGRSFAMCQTPAGPRIVHIGEKVGDLTLKRVAKQSAVFVSSRGKEISFRVKPAGT